MTIETKSRKKKKVFKKMKKALNYLNMPFVIWILSTVVLGSFSYLITKYNSRLRAHEEKLHSIQNLDMEIEYRTSQFLSNLKSTIEFPVNSTEVSNKKRLFVAFKDFKRPPENITLKTINPLYPGYANRSLISLLSELLTLTADEKIQNSMNYISSVEICTSNLTNCGITVNTFWKEFRANFLNNESWKNHFNYTGCDKLFCE